MLSKVVICFPSWTVLKIAVIFKKTGKDTFVFLSLGELYSNINLEFQWIGEH